MEIKKLMSKLVLIMLVIGVIDIIGQGNNSTSKLIQRKPSISGYVKTSDGKPIKGVTITFSNNGGSTITYSNGYYIKFVPYGWSGTVTPSKQGYTFNPTYRSYSNVTSKQTNQNYTGIPNESELTWNSVNDWVYQLQNINLNNIGETKFDLVVIDYSSDGTEEGRFTATQINTLKNSSGGQKLVLAYMSIGEAENYRWYWDDSWDKDHDGNPDPGAPSWLGPSNPQWPGNYKVKYWEEGWQEIIYGSPTSYLDKIIEAGFDGVYLDIIDAYEYWGPGGESGLNRVTAEQEMVDFVKDIANYARVTKGKTDFGVFPQNGEGLSVHSDYVAIVTGIAKEDTWYNGNRPNNSTYINQVIENLDVFKEAGKLVLVIDYVTKQNLIDDFYSKAIEKGYIPYASVRALNKLTINPGHEPD